MRKRKLWVSIVAGLLAAVMLLSMIVGMLSTTVSAASSSEIKKQLDVLEDEKDTLKDQMDDVRSQYKANEDEITDMVNQKNTIDQEIFLLNQQMTVINDQIAAYNLLIADKQDELDQAQARLTELNQKNKERIRAMEEDGSVTYWSVLFKASSFSDLLDRMNMIEEIAAADQRRLEEMSEAAKIVSDAKAALSQEKDALEVTKAELADTEALLLDKQQQSQDLLNKLIEKGFELEDLYEQLESEEDELQDRIAAKEKEYDKAKYAEYMATYTTVPPTTQATQPTTSNTTGTTTGADVPASSGTWARPCSGYRVTSSFGPRKAPTAGASTYHRGIDLAAPQGTPIYAARTGVVTTAAYNGSAGYYVSINHGDGFSSVYMHLTHYVVKSGQAVSQGQLIGYMGSTGVSTGSHLHFGIAYNGTYVNPANYINF